MSTSPTSCIAASTVSGNNNTCLVTTASLPPLPPIIRGDKEAYLEQRLGLPPLAPSVDANMITHITSSFKKTRCNFSKKQNPIHYTLLLFVHLQDPSKLCQFRLTFTNYLNLYLNYLNWAFGGVKQEQP